MLKRVIAGLLVVVGLFLVWGLLEPYVIDEQRFEVALPNLPASWSGQEVAVIADLQVGMWLDNTPTVRRIVSRLVERKPALVLIAGDFIYHPRGDGGAVIAEAVALVRPLAAAGVPTYAVLGNHDYAMPTEEASKDEVLAESLRAALEAAGVKVLHNQAVALPSPPGGTRSAPLYLVGVGARAPREDDPQAALAELPPDAARLALMHHPESFEAFPAGSAPLAVAAHTHGGQFRVPFTPSWTWMSYARENEVHADGWIQNYGNEGNRLYVNRGIGFSVLPLRLNCPPELTLFTLRPG